MPRAFITGITGQDGSYLADFLLKKGYEVHGLKRRSSSFNTGRLDHIYEQLEENLHFGDMTDGMNLIRLIEKINPDEVYNLAAQSHVAVSFETPEYTANADALGTLRLLEAMRITGCKGKFYQASSSEMFGNAPVPQNEDTPFKPISPYGIAKLFAHHTAVNYREAYGMPVSCGILFNHESPVRGETFVSRKIVRGALNPPIRLGNLDARRDWGHASDYVEGMWLMLQHEPDDFVLATGKSHSVREFVNAVFEEIAPGDDRRWVGTGCVIVDEKYMRPTDIDELRGDATKARTVLGWEPKVTFRELVAEMVKEEIDGSISTTSGRQSIRRSAACSGTRTGAEADRAFGGTS